MARYGTFTYPTASTAAQDQAENHKTKCVRKKRSRAEQTHSQNVQETRCDYWKQLSSLAGSSLLSQSLTSGEVQRRPRRGR